MHANIRPQARHAIRRLHKDWKELEREKGSLSTITALPTSDIFIWHCNLRPDHGPLAGTIFHLVLKFPETYPHAPPKVELCSYLKHPNVFGAWICLDMIKLCYTDAPYQGWTTAYSVLSLLLQLQSFLFAENIPQDYGGYHTAHTSAPALKTAVRDAHSFVCKVQTHDGSWVTHTHSHPWPPLPKNMRKIPYHSKAATKRDGFQFRSEDFPALDGTITYETPPATEISSSAYQERFEMVKEEPSAAPRQPLVVSVLPVVSPADLLPSAVYTNIFSFLDVKDIFKARDVCSHWRRVIVTHNIFERSQIICFHSKVSLDDSDTILGIGLQVEYYPDGKQLKGAFSPLDILSLRAFDEEGVRMGVWGGRAEAFDFFLPLIFNNGHASTAVKKIEDTAYRIMAQCAVPILDNTQVCPEKIQMKRQCFNEFHPSMVFQLLATLMNSMVVELMNSTGCSGTSIQRHTSEKALEGYCAFHHMLLYFAKRYPALIGFADRQICLFISSEQFRCKQGTPNLGILLICLTLSKVGWGRLKKTFVLEAFDRNVRWLLQKSPKLSQASLPARTRLAWTFQGAKTSLRLMMFQVYFLSCIGRPPTLAGPFDILGQYDMRLGLPSTAQKEDLQRNAKKILSVTTWDQFFQRLGGPVPDESRLNDILRQAVRNSKRKKYHR